MIRFNDFTSEPTELGEQELVAVQRVLRSGRFILGPDGEAFEEAWAKFCGMKFCVGVANGMDAIEIALRALGIGAGDEVITTSMTAMASVFAIIRAGATPVLADVDLATALLDLASVERCLSAKTKAVLAVHLYGQLRTMEQWMKLCHEAKIHLVEDCAQAHGATWNGKHAGAFGACGAFSFYPTKNLGARGDAGALITSSAELAERARRLRNYGARDRYQHAEVGINSRLDEIQAAILLRRLEWLNRFNARRKQIAQKYFAKIDNTRIELLSPPAQEGSHVYHLFVVRCAERDRLAEFLKARGVETLIHYPTAAHQQDCAKDIRCDPRGLKNVEHHAARCLSLPCHPQLRDNEVESVIAAINQFE